MFCVFLFQVEKNGFVVMKLERGIRFPAVDLIQTVLDEKSLMTKNPKSVIIDFTHVSSIDFSVVEVSKTFNSWEKKKKKVNADNYNLTFPFCGCDSLCQLHGKGV